MENIEQTIVELGGIFSKLAHMVKEQEEEIKRYFVKIIGFCLDFSFSSFFKPRQVRDPCVCLK